jgi:xanthine dehydrogenase YagS FAD-binding subunit
VKTFEWAQPTSVGDALKLLKEPGAMVYAGGVDLLDRMKEGLDEPSRLVSLRRIPSIASITADGNRLRIGAGATLQQIADHPTVRSRFTALAGAAGHAATPQIRAMATIGGNLVQRTRCWYFRSDLFHCRKKGGTDCMALAGDNQHHALFANSRCASVHPSSLATALVALDASVTIATPDGKQRAIKVQKLYEGSDITRDHELAAGEIITEIVVDPWDDMRSAYIKQGAKRSFDWPIAEVAVALQIRGDRVSMAQIVLGGAAPLPWRSHTAEEALRGSVVGEQSARAAGDASVLGARPLSDNEYKVAVFRAVVARTILAAAKGG